MNRLKIFFFGLLAFLFAAFIGFVIFLLIGSMHEPEVFIIIIISVSAFNPSLIKKLLPSKSTLKIFTFIRLSDFSRFISLVIELKDANFAVVNVQ